MEKFTKMVESLATNPWAVLGGYVIGLLGLVGIPLTILLYFRSKKDRLPRYSVRTNNIIKGHKEKYPAVTVHFENYGEDIANLSVSKVIFWNYGRETIKKGDVVKPGIFLRIKDGCKILDVSVVQISTEENKFTITRTQDRASATIAFEYIDEGEGVMIQVFHTGTSDEDLSITGKVMGAGEPLRMAITPSTKPPSVSNGILFLLMPFLITCLLCAPVLFGVELDPLDVPKPVKLEPIEIPRALAWVLLISFFTMIYGVSWFAAYVVMTRRMPKKLDELFLSDF